MTEFQLMTDAAEENAVWMQQEIDLLREKLEKYKRERLASQQECEELLDTYGNEHRDLIYILVPFFDKMWARFRALE